MDAHWKVTVGFASVIMRGWMQLQCTAETKDASAQYYDSESFEQRHRRARSAKAADGTLTGGWRAEVRSRPAATPESIRGRGQSGLK